MSLSKDFLKGYIIKENGGFGFMKYIVGVFILIFLVFIILGAVIIGMWNGLIGKDEKVKEAWAQIDTQLQRRADLIPNLVSTVQGYAKHEKEIFENVSSARSKLLGAQGPQQKAEASGELSSALGRLLAISERYPDLKANTNFIRLQDELAGTENRIAVARTRYNDAVRILNQSIRQFPGAIFASMMSLKPAEYFQPPDKAKARQVPEVKF
jgi:LemA protein